MTVEPRCRLCCSRKRDDVDRGLRAGRSQRDVARQFAFSKSAVARHAPHVDRPTIDPKAECEMAAHALDEFLLTPLASSEDVLSRGKQLLDAQVRFARALAPENPQQAAAITARAHAALIELHARAFKVIGTDSQAPAVVDNSVKILAVLDRLDVDALRTLAGGDPLALSGDQTAP